MEGHKVRFEGRTVAPRNNTMSHSDLLGSMRIPVTVTSSASPNDTLENVDDPFGDMGHQMDHEVERVLREWDTNTQKITHDTFRLRPTLSSSTPNSPFNARRKKFSNSLSNLSAAGDFSQSSNNRKSFADFPEINVSRREDSRLNNSVESLTEEIKSPLYTTCTRTGRKILKMEFDTEGYGPDNITVKVAENKLVIHAVQNEAVDGRKSTTEFCRKIKLPLDVNPKLLQCYFNPASNQLVAEAPVLRQNIMPSVSSTTSHHPPIPQHHFHPRQELVNVPFVRQEFFGKTMYLNVEVGKVFHPDDVTVKVKGQDKIIVNADRVENNDSSKLNASIYREFDVPDRIQPKTLKAGFSPEGVLKISALLEEQGTSSSENGKINVELLDNGIGVHKKASENGINGLH